MGWFHVVQSHDLVGLFLDFLRNTPLRVILVRFIRDIVQVSLRIQSKAVDLIWLHGIEARLKIR